MKVTFYLSPTQYCRAREDAVVWVPKRREGLAYRGNLLAHQQVSEHFNFDQRMELVDRVIVYEGQRHALHQDGGLLVLAKVAGYSSTEAAIEDGFFNLRVLKYDTSDSRLQWFETLESYMLSRASDDELRKWIVSGSGYQHQKVLDEAAKIFDALRHVPPDEYPEALRPRKQKE